MIRFAAAGFVVSAGGNLRAQFETSSSGASVSYHIRGWGQEAGLWPNHITAIAQTGDGYLWLGSYEGLTRFDGVRFTPFDGVTTPALRDARVVSLHTARDGTLWVGNETGHVARLKDGRFEAVRTASEGATESVAGFHEDAAGRIWTVDQQGGVDPVESRRSVVPETRTNHDFVVSTSDTQGQLWMTRRGSLSKWENQKLKPVKVAQEWLTNTVYGLGRSRRSGLWLSSEGLLQRWDDGRWLENWGPAPWGTEGVTQLVELQNGTLAIGTLNRGLYLWEKGSAPQHFDIDHGLPHNRIRAIFEDHEHTIWVGTGGGGLVSLRAAPFVQVQPPGGWQGRSVLCVAPARAGGVWVGTEGGGLFRFAEGRWKHFGAAEGLTNPFVWAVTEQPGGELIVGTWGGGVYRKTGDAARFERDPGFDPVVPVTTIYVPPAGDVAWFGTSGGAVAQSLGAGPAPQEISLAEVRCVVEDASGRLWFGMLGGGLAVRRADGTIQRFSTADGLASDVVLSLFADPDGSLWIGTSGGGLNRWKDGRFAVVNTAHGLPSNVIGRMIEDEGGFLWISSQVGILRVRKRELNRCADGELTRLDVRSFSRSDGLPSVQSSGSQASACRTADGHLWFCTTKGLVHVDPANLSLNRVAPPVRMEEMRIDDAVRNAGEASITIEPGVQRVQLRYTALSLAAPEKVRFRHRLVGLDDRWTETGSERETAYNLLPPGRYRFEVLACNNDGVWTTNPAVQRFVVRPFYWQTWWFQTGAAGLVVLSASLAGIWGARMRLRRRLAVAERQHAIERERARIARDIHDDVGSSLTRITLLSQSALATDSSASGSGAELAQIYSTARELTRSMGEIVWAVNPRHDSLDSLASFVGKYAQEFLAAARIRCRLNFPLDLPPWPLTSEVRHNVFLACKEILNNTARHAGATEVRIEVESEASQFRFHIEDDGIGFDPATAAGAASGQPGGNGLRNLQQRLAEIGGTCAIAALAGGGVRVTLTVPFVATESDPAQSASPP